MPTKRHAPKKRIVDPDEKYRPKQIHNKVRNIYHEILKNFEDLDKFEED